MFGGKDAGGGGSDRRGMNQIVSRDQNMDAAFQSPYDVGLELHGIIYIFNPPDKSLRSISAAEGDVAKPAADIPPATEPAPADPPEATPENEAVEPGVDPAAPVEPAPAAQADPNNVSPDAVPAEEAGEFQPGAEPAASDAPATEEEALPKNPN